MEGLWFFIAGMVLGAGPSTFGLYIAMKRNEHLRQQLRVYMNPDYTKEELDEIFDGKV